MLIHFHSFKNIYIINVKPSVASLNQLQCSQNKISEMRNHQKTKVIFDIEIVN